MCGLYVRRGVLARYEGGGGEGMVGDRVGEMQIDVARVVMAHYHVYIDREESRAAPRVYLKWAAYNCVRNGTVLTLAPHPLVYPPSCKVRVFRFTSKVSRWRTRRNNLRRETPETRPLRN